MRVTKSLALTVLPLVCITLYLFFPVFHRGFGGYCNGFTMIFGDISPLSLFIAPLPVLVPLCALACNHMLPLRPFRLPASIAMAAVPLVLFGMGSHTFGTNLYFLTAGLCVAVHFIKQIPER